MAVENSPMPLGDRTNAEVVMNPMGIKTTPAFLSPTVVHPVRKATFEVPAEQEAASADALSDPIPSADSPGKVVKAAIVSSYASQAMDLIMWKEQGKSAATSGIGALLLLSARSSSHMPSLVSVASYGLMMNLAYGFFRGVVRPSAPMPAAQISKATVEKAVDKFVGWTNFALEKHASIFNGRDSVLTMKVSLFLWTLGQLGGMLSPFTLLFMSWVGAFTIPKLLSAYKEDAVKLFEVAHKEVSKHYAEIPHKKAVASISAITLFMAMAARTKLFLAFLAIVYAKNYFETRNKKGYDESIEFVRTRARRMSMGAAQLRRSIEGRKGE